MRMLVLADDLTGALEAGAKFAGEGITSLVTTELSLSPPSMRSDVEVLVIDTDSRHLSPSDAGRRVRILSSLARRLGIRYLYKKTDSTLRGNIGRELECLSTAFDGLPILYAPAYPEMGRTVVDGHLLVGGRPVTQTELSEDALNPIRESHIPTLLASQSSLPVFSLPSLHCDNGIPSGIHVCDGRTDEDITACARLFLETQTLRLAAGPAALAHGIARLADWPRKILAPLPSVERCLIVSGSRSEVSVRQMECALNCGFRSSSPTNVTDELLASLSWIILEPAGDVHGNPLQIARQVGTTIRDVLQQATPDALLIFGGDTARAVVQALGSPGLHPLGEVLPGVPLSRIARPDTRHLYMMTKAGGFGSNGIIAELRRQLQRKD
ncbi:MAG TPA: four-carbon acid sugar kinase family protein [Acidobacteriota bacterium]|nr:four-carbon acid sugar kinase family protein [Acidobacteriota bacterium]